MISRPNLKVSKIIFHFFALKTIKMEIIFLNSGAALLSPTLKHVCESLIFVIYRHRTKKSEKKCFNENIKRTFNYSNRNDRWTMVHSLFSLPPSIHYSARKSFKMSHLLKKCWNCKQT